MNVFITGSNGFIGSHLTAQLIKRGHVVKGLVLPGTATEELRKSGCEAVEGDIRHTASFEKNLAGADVVFHLAARVADWGRWSDFYTVNVDATRKLLDAAVRQGVKRFVLVSSLSIHKATGYSTGDESVPRTNRQNPYSLSKIMAEDIVNEFYYKKLLETVIIRPGLFPFGPGDRTSFYHWAGALKRGKLPFVNKGRSLLCTAYVENLAEGISLAGESAKASGNTYIIADEKPVTWRDFTGLVARMLDVALPSRSIPSGLAMPAAWICEKWYKNFAPSSPPPLTCYRVSVVSKDFYFTPAKAMRELGYTPHIPLEEGVARTVKWYLNQVKLKQ